VIIEWATEQDEAAMWRREAARMDLCVDDYMHINALGSFAKEMERKGRAYDAALAHRLLENLCRRLGVDLVPAVPGQGGE